MTLKSMTTYHRDIPRGLGDNRREKKDKGTRTRWLVELGKGEK